MIKKKEESCQLACPAQQNPPIRFFEDICSGKGQSVPETLQDKPEAGNSRWPPT